VDVLKYVGELGVAGVLAVLMLLAYDRLVRQLADVIKNNTEAMTRLIDATQSNVTLVVAHDKRADDMQGALARVESGVSQLLELAKVQHHNSREKSV
jgi:hypothetical protein